MGARANEPDEEQSISTSELKAFDRYSHLKTDNSDIIYDTKRDNAWIQATRSLQLAEWR